MSDSSIRNVVKYNCQALFMGPAPETGYNFISYTGEVNNDHTELIKNHNLLKEIIRVQEFGYSITLNRTDLTQLGEKSLLSRPNINYPQVELNFSYLPNGLRNEARMGFMVNYGQFEYPFEGEAFYDKTEQVCFLSGFDTQALDYVDYTGVGNVWPEVGVRGGGSGALWNADRYWPTHTYRDRRNVYAIVTDGDPGTKNDAHEIPLREVFDVQDDYQQVDPDSDSHHLISFGDCYLSRYNVSASVGDVMRANASFVAEKVEFHSGASGLQIPSCNLKNGNHYIDKASDGFVARPDPSSSNFTYFRNTQQADDTYFPPGLYTISYVSGQYYPYAPDDGRYFGAGNQGDAIGVEIRFTNPEEFGHSDSVRKNDRLGAGKKMYSGYLYTNSGWSKSAIDALADLVPTYGTFEHGGGKIGIRVNDDADNKDKGGYDIQADGRSQFFHPSFEPSNWAFDPAGDHNPDGTNNQIAFKLTPPSDIATRVVTPLDYPDEGPVAFTQGDLILRVPNDISGMGIDFDDSHIQNFSLEIDLNRDPMDSLGYRYPIYRGINFPVFANLSFTTLVKDSTTGSLGDTLRRGDEYDFKIRVKNSCDVNVKGVHPNITGLQNPHNAATLGMHQSLDSIVYEIKKAKLMGANFTSSIGRFKRADFNFSVEIDPDDLTKGLFVSGLLNVEKIEDFFLLEGGSSNDQNGWYLLREGGNAQDKSLLVTNLNPLY